ncbi:MAG: ATP-binding cassette domain-containing protein [Candidatus Latescibacter sp.]|nr:ATP-binding cassette domain-containing protein [Candidatus Latescibacter sp.]
MIDVQNLTKYYGTKLALDKISFTVRKGEVLGFLGPNGAGKSTAMKIITCYLSPTEGTVKVDGMDVVNDSLEVRKRIGYLPENPPLYMDMTVKTYLEFAAKIKGVPSSKLRESVSSVVEKCGLNRYYRAYCNSLSKGFRQRVGIAQAMIHNPLIMVLDEPTIGLDPIQIVEIRNLIKGFGGDHTVILSTHILPEVDMTCERVIIINNGIMVAEDSTKNLRARLPQKEQFVIEVRGDVRSLLPKIEKIPGITGIFPENSTDGISSYKIETDSTADVRPEVARTVVGENLELLQLRDVSLTLEDIFIQVTMK